MEWFFIVSRLTLSLASNVFQKKLTQRGLHAFFIVSAIYCVLAICALALLIKLPIAHLNHAFWRDVSLSALFDVGGWLFLVVSLSKTDLSVFGPLNAYKVVASMLLAMLFLNEFPSAQGLIGVSIIIAGSFFLMPQKSPLAAHRVLDLLSDKGVQARFLSILLFAIGTLFLKQSVMNGGVLQTLVFWSLIGLPIALASTYFVLKQRVWSEVAQASTQLSNIAAVGIMVFAMQYATLYLLSTMLIAYALALFQLGMVLQVFIGYKVFNEQEILRKLLASLVMMAGSLLVLLA